MQSKIDRPPSLSEKRKLPFKLVIKSKIGKDKMNVAEK